MKKLFLMMILLFASKIYASHTAGAYINYKPIANDRYRITLTLFRYCDGALFGTISKSVALKNAQCNINQMLTLNLISNSGLPLPDECSIGLPPTNCNGGTRFGLEKYVYEGEYTVPNNLSHCSIWTIEAQIVCCRNFNNSTNSEVIFVEASFNHGLPTKNESVRKTTTYLPAFCAGKEIEIDLTGDNIDNDSLVYTLNIPRTNKIIPINYNTGLSYLKPIEIDTNTSVQLNSSTGILKLKPADKTQIGVFGYRITEYKKVNNAWILAGWSDYDMQFYFENNPIFCDFIKPKFIEKNISLGCYDSIITLNFNTKIQCSSISTNGTEFLLKTPSNLTWFPEKVQIANCNQSSVYPFFSADKIRVILKSPFAQNGTFQLITKNGNNNNTFQGFCGKLMDENEVINITISGCLQNPKVLPIQNVTVNQINNKDVFITWKAIEKEEENSFTNYSIYRRKSSEFEWNQIKSITNLTQTTYLDTNIDATIEQVYYRITYNKKFYIESPKSDSVSTILLKIQNPISTIHDPIKLNWVEKVAWDNPKFQIDHRLINEPQWTTIHSFISKSVSPIEAVKPTTPGLHLYRVSSTNALTNSISYSNWDYYITPSSFKPNNFITPNQDGINDFFVVDNLDYTTKLKISIYNSNGKLVYKSENYQNNWGPGNISGSYYYIIQLPNGGNNKGFILLQN